jgi:hypothetical protein
MGSSTSWVAVHGATIEELAERLQLTETTEQPARDAISYEVGALSNGWVILLFRMRDNGVVADTQLLEELSRTWRVFGCDEETHVMYSAASEWRDGREVWAVIHRSDEAPDHVDVRGTLPADAIAVKDEYVAKHAAATAAGDNVDHVYEIAVALGRRVVGYSLDGPENDDLALVTLKSRPPRSETKKPWWKRG